MRVHLHVYTQIISVPEWPPVFKPTSYRVGDVKTSWDNPVLRWPDLLAGHDEI